MSTVTFRFEFTDQAPAGTVSLKRALRSRMAVQLIVDGARVGGARVPRLSFVTYRRLERFLQEYRRDPDETRALPWIRELLHQLLFGGQEFDGHFGRLQDAATQIAIDGAENLSSLISNIPWEMAAGVLGERSPLLGTLAALPLSRRVEGTHGVLNLAKGGPLRVSYLVARPPDDQGLPAEDFDRMLRQILRAREGFVSFCSLVGDVDPASHRPTYRPTIAQLYGHIDASPPHILILVAHGSTENGTGMIKIDGTNGFSSVPLIEIGTALGRKMQTFLVFLIACDQTHQASHAALSGAASLLKGGVPWAVAMQSKVRVDLAQQFLSASLDHLLTSSSLPECVAVGRRSMQVVSGQTLSSYTDWSFPAVFACANSQDFVEPLKQFFRDFPLALTRLAQGIPNARPYFPRSDGKIDNTLNSFLSGTAAGARAVKGAIGRGKTQAIRFACREVLQAAVEAGTLKGRRILYVDLDHEGMPDVRHLTNKIGRLNAELRSQFMTSPPLRWSTPRSADGEGQPLDTADHLVELIDLNNMILVLDNIAERDAFPWLVLAERFQRLRDSLVVLCIEPSVRVGFPASDILEVTNLTEAGTAAYVSWLDPSRIALSKQWYDDTGGILLLLDELSRGQVLPSSQMRANLMQEQLESHWPNLGRLFTRRIDAETQSTSDVLSVLSNGITTSAARWLRVDLQMIQRMADAGVLSFDHRYEGETRWHMPRLLREALSQGRHQEICRTLAEHFVARVWEEGDVCEALTSLCAKPGGVDLIIDAQIALVGAGMMDTARRLPLLLHEYLFSHGRWMDALRLIRYCLDAAPDGEGWALLWINRANAAHCLGYVDEASTCLDTADAMNPSDLEKVSILDLRASLIKDKGSFDRESDAYGYYQQCYQYLDRLKASLDAAENKQFSGEDIDERRAIVLYNEAHLRRWWGRDIPMASRCLEEASELFRRAGNPRMYAMATVANVDFLLEWNAADRDWDALMQNLLGAYGSLSSNQASSGDAAFAAYTLRRMYCRMPASGFVRQENLRKAMQALDECILHAVRAGDLRQEAIAMAHRVELGWSELHDMDSQPALDCLHDACRCLRTFRGDRWSQRVLRNELLVMARIQWMTDQAAALTTIREAIEVALASPLAPEKGTDARRAARVLLQTYRWLDAEGQGLAADKLSVRFADLLNSWLHRVCPATSRSEWMRELETFAQQEVM